MKLAVLAFLVSPIPAAAAQAGPWTDGGLLVVNHDTPGVHRVAPETGASALLPNSYSALPQLEDPAAFDSFRGDLPLSAPLLPAPGACRACGCWARTAPARP
ncbi:MAG: hypothetical protein FJ296_11045 [Planctomycetes bacterium]|nr:hypothetical protein [Planctomycetota bacterium]